MKIHLNCREVAHLVLDSQDRPLPRLDRMALRLHWAMCKGCRNFRDQTRAMRLGLDRWRSYRDEGQGGG